MTRKDELKQRAYTTVRDMIADGVKLSGGQCVVSEYAVFKALQQVEREVLADIMQQTQRYQQFAFGQERTLEFEAGFRAAARTLEGWIEARQKELG